MDDKKLTNYFFVIIGPSGSGKTRITEAVFPNSYKIISHTTRPIRSGEVPGKDYYFETEKSFDSLIKTNALAEYDTYNGYRYGVAIGDLVEATNKHIAYDVLTFNGFLEIEKKFGKKVIPIFLDVSREQVLFRLKEREDQEEQIKERMALYKEEIGIKEQLQKYPENHVINANHSFEVVTKALKKIIQQYEK